MANEMMYVNIIAQAHMTAIQALLRVIELGSESVTDKTYLKSDEIGLSDDKFSTLFIPRDLKEEFIKQADKAELFYIMAGESYKVDDKEFKFIDSDPLSDYLMIKTLAPEVLLDNEGNPILDDIGNTMFVPGTDKDLRLLTHIASDLNHQYLERKASIIASNYMFNTADANNKWANTSTVSIDNLTLSEVNLMQKRASDLKINSFAHYNIEERHYSLELEASSFDRNPMLPNVMSPAESLLSDYVFAINCPKVSDYLDACEKKHDTLSSSLAKLRSGDGLDKDITLVSYKNSGFDPYFGAEPPVAIRFHDNFAEILTPDGYDGTLIDLRDNESFSYVSDLIDKIGLDYVILDTALYEQAVGKFSHVVNEDNEAIIDENGLPALVWQPNQDIDTWERNIGCHKDESSYFDSLIGDIYKEAKGLRDNGLIDLSLKDSLTNGCKYVESRIPESDTIIASTIINKFGPESELINKDLEIEQLRHNIDVSLTDLKVSLASHYSSTPAFIKKNKAEQLLDDRSLGFSHLESGESVPESLSPEEIAQYFESVDSIAEYIDFGTDDSFEDFKETNSLYPAYNENPSISEPYTDFEDAEFDFSSF